MDFLILLCAVYRLVLLLLRDRIAAPVRSLAQRGPDWLQYLLRCPHCLSVWAAGTAVALQWFGGTPGRFLVMTLAVSGAFIWIPALLQRAGGNSGNLQRDRGPGG